ncbi:putative cyclin-dependent serine/threonine-protein kinase DDB_G0272797/DDB_G0274007 [Procambarus clarkii]|uniref:putative cyclin-dependent serine/threonine-protein kinase DDB_G0272797/DDB_G0274007 n=1 Tax=Procambarus clarkii TaxID=6728 RepID=UPI0037432928
MKRRIGFGNDGEFMSYLLDVADRTQRRGASGGSEGTTDEGKSDDNDDDDQDHLHDHHHPPSLKTSHHHQTRNGKSREANGECERYTEVAPRRTTRLQEATELHEVPLDTERHGTKIREGRRSSRHSKAAEKPPKNNNHLKELNDETEGKWNLENRLKAKEGTREYETHTVLERRVKTENNHAEERREKKAKVKLKPKVEVKTNTETTVQNHARPPEADDDLLVQELEVGQQLHLHHHHHHHHLQHYQQPQQQQQQQQQPPPPQQQQQQHQHHQQQHQHHQQQQQHHHHHQQPPPQPLPSLHHQLLPDDIDIESNCHVTLEAEDKKKKKDERRDEKRKKKLKHLEEENLSK